MSPNTASALSKLQPFLATDRRSRFLTPSIRRQKERYITIGRAFTGKLLVVVHTERGNNIRIISARRASRRERKFYEKVIE
jgi:uncharacterized DUF497 family protein